MADEMVPKVIVDLLLQQNATMQTTITSLQTTIVSLQATVEKLTVALEEKNQIILNLNRARFGQSSEKSSYVLSDGQMSMFEITGDGLSEKADTGSSACRTGEDPCSRAYPEA